KLIIGPARNDFHFKLRDRLIVDYATERTRRKHISIASVNLVRRNSSGGEFFHQTIGLRRIYVRHDQTSPGIVEIRSQVIADIAAALKRYRSPSQHLRVPSIFCGSLESSKHSARSERRRVA